MEGLGGSGNKTSPSGNLLSLLSTSLPRSYTTSYHACTS